MDIKNQKDSMSYRRFGKTEQWLSTITLGGMRYHEGWNEPRNQPSTQMIDQCVDITSRMFAQGVNHIETAYGYVKSEHCYGIALNDILKWKRDDYILMTKGGAETASDMRKMVESQLTALKTDHIDLYGWHGINTPRKLKVSTASGGPVEELLKMQDEGIIGSVGFSTHGPLEVIIEAIATGLFSFVNLHYYYFMQRNRGAVDYAAAKDMGVFIISPNDKGGKLYQPSPKLTQLCAPLTPIQFNARWCLNHPAIHTLSFGVSEPEHITEMAGIHPFTVPLSAEDLAITHRMNGALLTDPIANWEGYELINDPSGINIPEVIRMRRMWKCYDQTSFGDMRYNMFEAQGDWFPGVFATPDAVQKIDTSKTPAQVNVTDLLNETHEKFYSPKKENS